MRFPTTYSVQSIDYFVVCEGIQVPDGFPVPLNVSELSEAAAAARVAAFEAGLQALGEHLLTLDGVTRVRVYRTYRGSAGGEDIFQMP